MSEFVDQLFGFHWFLFFILSYLIDKELVLRIQLILWWLQAWDLGNFDWLLGLEAQKDRLPAVKISQSTYLRWVGQVFLRVKLLFLLSIPQTIWRPWFWMPLRSRWLTLGLILDQVEWVEMFTSLSEVLVIELTSTQWNKSRNGVTDRWFSLQVVGLPLGALLGCYWHWPSPLLGVWLGSLGSVLGSPSLIFLVQAWTNIVYISSINQMWPCLVSLRIEDGVSWVVSYRARDVPRNATALAIAATWVLTAVSGKAQF